LDKGRHEAAVEHLRTAFDQAPEDKGISRALLQALVRLGRSDEAIAFQQKARSFEPDDEDTVAALSILLVDRGRFADAVTLLSETAGRFPTQVVTATTLARLLASSPDATLRDGGRAFELAQNVFASDPTAGR
jgi:Flp pilus assembly protein TadD